MAKSVALLTLSNGRPMPQLGLGTWLSKPGQVASAVKCALLDAGYKHIDCAQAYMNQAEVGAAFKDVFDSGKVKREDVFITSKIWNTFHSYKAAGEAVDAILGDLQLQYLDLCLIHWPQGYLEGAGIFPRAADGVKMIHSDVDYLDTWRAMEEAVAAGKIRSIGLSNFNTKQTQRVIDNAKVKPTVLQVELHPYFPQRELVRWCKQRDIVVTGYSPLANITHLFRKEGQPNLLTEQVLVDIGSRHNKSTAQVALRWHMQNGTVAIPKSVTDTRIKENGAVFDFELSAAEMEQLDKLDSNWRICDLTRDLDHPHFPFHEL